MQKIDLLEMSARGDNDFESLSEVEKDLYVLYLFYTLRDMEGITHFYSYYYYTEHLPRLLALLTAANAPNAHAIAELSEFLREKSGGAWNVEALDDYLSNISGEDNARIGAWDQEYDGQTSEMWDCVRAYCRQRYEATFD